MTIDETRLKAVCDFWHSTSIPADIALLSLSLACSHSADSGALSKGNRRSRIPGSEV